jgi:hypothetical protein
MSSSTLKRKDNPIYDEQKIKKRINPFPYTPLETIKVEKYAVKNDNNEKTIINDKLLNCCFKV